MRQDAEQKAIKYRISASHLEEVTDVLIANNNGTPHEGINNLLPLEALQQRILRGMLIRTIPEEQRKEVAFFSMKVERTINGSKQQGRRPHINYEGITYHNEILSRSYDLIGEKIKSARNTLSTLNRYLEEHSNEEETVQKNPVHQR